MGAKETVAEMLDGMTEEEATMLLEAARRLSGKSEQEGWTAQSLLALSRAYADDEPEYGPEDGMPCTAA
ncbi:MAG TPA: hypothetical protein VGN26_08675 [Armatimonadota bacterium]